MLSSFLGGDCDLFISCHCELRSFDFALVSSRCCTLRRWFRAWDLWSCGVVIVSSGALLFDNCGTFVGILLRNLVSGGLVVELVMC